MMIKLVKPFLSVFLPILIIFSCAKEETESEESIYDRILKAYIEVNYSDLEPNEYGIYVINSVSGTGESIEDSAYAYVRYSTLDLQENYLTSTYDSVAKQLGLYAKRSFYGPHVWLIGKGVYSEGREDIIMNMKIGGKTKAIFPYSLAGMNKIYDIELDTFVVNIKDYQIEQLEDYSSKYYGGLDSLKGYEGFYFDEIHDGGFNDPNDTIPDEAILNIKYIGRFLDGQVFDTNIKDSSIKYEIYNNGVPNETEMKVTYMKDFDQAIEKNNTAGTLMVRGFHLAILQMGYKDKCITFFDSNYGYGTTGNEDGSMPGYYPLFFEIWIEDEPTEEDEEDEEDDS